MHFGRALDFGTSPKKEMTQGQDSRVQSDSCQTRYYNYIAHSINEFTLSRKLHLAITDNRSIKSMDMKGKQGSCFANKKWIYLETVLEE